MNIMKITPVKVNSVSFLVNTMGLFETLSALGYSPEIQGECLKVEENGETKMFRKRVDDLTWLYSRT